MSQMLSYAGRAMAVTLVILGFIAGDTFTAGQWMTFLVPFAVVWGLAELVYAHHRQQGLY